MAAVIRDSARNSGDWCVAVWRLRCPDFLEVVVPQAYRNVIPKEEIYVLRALNVAQNRSWTFHAFGDSRLSSLLVPEVNINGTSRADFFEPYADFLRALAREGQQTHRPFRPRVSRKGTRITCWTPV
jgi:hypothetical protein